MVGGNMYLDEFKLWLQGYLVGAGVEEESELEEHQLIEIIKQLSEVEDRPFVDFSDPLESGVFHPRQWGSFGRVMPRFDRYFEKLTYTDTEGNKYEYTNKDGEEKVKTNIEAAEKLTARARGLITDALEKTG
jgi:hypothetical protein